MKMSKVELIRMIQNMEENDKGEVNISSSAVRGLSHVIIYNEIYNVIKEKYPTMEIKMPDDCNEIAKILDRNPAQVGYYLREMRNDEKIKLDCDEKEYKYIKVCRKIANYLIENDKRGESVYIIAKAIDEPVTSIIACVGKQSTLRGHTTFNGRHHVYDDRGRRRIEIEFASKKFFEKAQREDIDIF